MASATLEVSSRTSHVELLEWLQSVEDVSVEAADEVRTLFTKHQVDGALLHFLSSPVGARILQVFSDACVVPAAEENEAHAEDNAAAAKPKRSSGARGRQRISMNDRQQEKLNSGHYFASGNAQPQKVTSKMEKDMSSTRISSENATSKREKDVPSTRISSEKATSKTEKDMPSPNALSAYMLNCTGQNPSTTPPAGYAIGSGCFWDEKSGVTVRSEPLHLTPISDDDIVLYYYTDHAGFSAVAGDRNGTHLRASHAQRALFGDGIYASQHPPDFFGSKERILVNSHTNSSDVTKQQSQIKRLQEKGVADYCVPLVVSRSRAVNISREMTKEMAKPGHTLNHGPMREDRDVWVVAVSDSSDTVHSQKGSESLQNRRSFQADAPRSPNKKTLGEERRVRSSKRQQQSTSAQPGAEIGDQVAASGDATAESRSQFDSNGPKSNHARVSEQPLVQSPESVTGTLKSFSHETGYGFFHCESLAQDVFLNRNSLPPGCRPECGRIAKFEIVYDAHHRPQARNVIWQAVDEVQAMPARHYGRLKSFGKDFAFAECKEAFEMYGRDVYISKGQLPDNVSDIYKVSQPITFELILSAKGQPQGRNIKFEEAMSETDSTTDADESGATRW